MDRGAIDFTGAQFKAIAEECFAGLKKIFKTDETILAYAASGHGAWEAALVNLFSPGDKVLVVESGFFLLNWGMRAEAFGLEVQTLPNDWRSAANPAKLESRLREDREHAIKAVLVVHNETSTGVVNDVAELRRAIDAARHPALYLVDVISSLGSMDFRMDEWAVDVVVAGSQKGLMLPTGMAFTGVSARALAATTAAKLPRGSLGLAPAPAAKKLAGLLERHGAGAFLLWAPGSAADDRGGRPRQHFRPPSPVRPRPPGEPCVSGGRMTGPRSSPSTRAHNPIRSLPCKCLKATMPTRSARRALTNSMCR